MEARSIVKWVLVIAVIAVVCVVLYQLVVVILGLGNYLLWWTDDVANWWQQYIAEPVLGTADFVYTSIATTMDDLGTAVGVTWDGVTTYGEAISDTVVDAVSTIPDFLNWFAGLFSGFGG